jgi:hypothetical protein
MDPLYKTDLVVLKYLYVNINMDQPKTRKETKKNQQEKAKGKSIYTAKHVRLTEALRENNSRHK